MEDEKPCTFAVCNRRQDNVCMDHETAALVPSGPCSSCFFIYVTPKEKEDKRRWLGFLSNSGSLPATHSHPKPVPSKLGAKLKEDIEKAVQLDPSKTCDDISKGFGLGYSPSSFTIAAANKGTLSHFINQSRIDLSGKVNRNIIENFNDLVKKKVDEMDTKNAESEDLNNRILNYCTPYLRYSV